MSSKLAVLRTLLRGKGLSFYVVGSADRHNNEYTHPSDGLRRWISEFTGSAGTAIVGLDSAHLFTDGRYFAQANRELGSDWELHRVGDRVGEEQAVVNWMPWLAGVKGKIGIDPAVISLAEYRTLLSNLAESGNRAEIVPIEENLVETVWNQASENGWEVRPSLVQAECFKLGIEYTGEESGSKIARLRAELEKEGGLEGVVVSSLDQIAWLLNLRGNDIAYNPVFFAYAYVPTASSSPPTLFVNLPQLSDAVYQYLMDLNILIEPYSSFNTFLSNFGPTKRHFFSSSSSLSLALAISPTLSDANLLVKAHTPITHLKAIKNSTEIAGFAKCHARDGLALVRYFAWLENELKCGRRIDEFEGAEKLETLRKMLPLYQGLSFDTISSAGENAAIIHYKPPTTGSAEITTDRIYLCDSGAQFLDGTTDTTRTLHFGTPTAEMRLAYTRVLQGHIAIDTSVFPKGTTGYLLDVLARKPLWSEGLNYAHGTSHGVGSFLCVHEGPAGLGTRIEYNDVPLLRGMVLSNEPGYYQMSEENNEGFGIRIENVVGVVEKNFAKGKQQFLGFENYTLVPISTNLVDPALLTSSELSWLNEYNAKCLEGLRGSLEKDEKYVMDWLVRNTEAIA